MAKAPKTIAKGKGKAKPAPKGGGKKKPAKPAKAAAKEKVKPSETMKVTPGGTLKSLLSTCRGYKQNSDSVISKMREEIGYAVDKKGLHKGAFAELRKLDKMEPEKASEYWHTLNAYMESSGVMAKIEAVGRLPLGDDGEEDSEVAEAAADHEAEGNGAADVDPEVAGENVTRPQFGGAVRH